MTTQTLRIVTGGQGPRGAGAPLLDEADMASNRHDAAPSQRSVRTYVQNEVTAVLGAAAEGVTIKATWAELSAIPGTREGQPGRVPAGGDPGTHTDPVTGATEENEGEYAWSAAPAGWEWVGAPIDQAGLAASITAVFDGAAPQNSGFANLLYYDHRGTLGQVRTLYLPRGFSAKRGTTSVVYATAGTESARLPGYTELAIGATQTLVYADLTEPTAPFKAVAYSGAVPALAATMVPIAIINNTRVSRWFYRGEAVEGGLPRLYAGHPIVLDGSTLLVPHGIVTGVEFTDSLAAPTNRRWYKEIAAFTTGTKTLYFDHAQFLLGNDPWLVATYPASPRSPIAVPVVGVYNGDLINLSGVFVAGDVPGGRMSNIMDCGKNTPESADYLYGPAVPCDITDADLIAAGFTRGVQSPGSTLNLYGTRITNRAPGRWAFVRVWVQTDTSLNFGTPRAYWMNSATNVNAGNFQLSLEQRLSDHAAIYSGWGRMPANSTIDAIIVGGVVPVGVDIRHCGVQIGYGSEVRGWIKRDDFPEPGRPLEALVRDLKDKIGEASQPAFLYPADMWLVEGRPQEIYPGAMLETRGEDNELRMVFASASDPDGLPLIAAATAGNSIRVDPNACGASGELTLRLTSEASQKRWTRPVTIHKATAAALAGKAPKIHIVSDSLMYNTGVPYAMERKMTALGMTPSWVGTIPLQEDGVAGAIMGESRSGMEWAKYIHADPGTPLAVGDEATYLGLTVAERLGYNPYIRPQEIGDDAELVKNGYVWAFSFYLTRWPVDLAAPDYVIVNLGTNDGGHYALASALAHIENGMRIFVAQIRAALPDAKIAIIGNPLARSAAGDVRWNSVQVATIRKLMEVAADIADDKLWVLPGWAHASQDVGWEYQAGSTDAVTGLVTTEIGDFLHPRGPVSEQLAELLTAWIACQEAGV